MSLDLHSMSREELLSLRGEVDAALESLEERRREAAREAAEKAVAEYGFALPDVLGPQTKRKAPKGRSKNPPKYRNPDNPRQTWSGRGRRPDWINAAVEQGKSIEDFRI